MNKTFLSIFLVVLMCSSLPLHAEAKDPYVTDCLDENADCSDNSSPNVMNNDESNLESNAMNTGSVFFDLIKMVFALLLVLVLIYVLLKFLNKRNKLFHQVKAIENLGGISVGPSKSIQLVRLGTKMYLIGVGDNVEMLHEITDEELKKDILQNAEEENNFQASNLLSSFFQNKSKNDKVPGNQQKKEFKNMFSNELDKLKQNRNKIIEQHKQMEDKHE